MIWEGCRGSYYPHYPIISNDRWLPDISPIMLQHHLWNSHFACLNLTLRTQFSLRQHWSACKNRHGFGPHLLSDVCFDSSDCFFFLAYSTFLDEAVTAGSRPPSIRHARAPFVYVWHVSSVCRTAGHQVMCCFVPCSANHSPPKKENKISHQRLITDSTGSFNYQKCLCLHEAQVRNVFAPQQLHFLTPIYLLLFLPPPLHL